MVNESEMNGVGLATLGNYDDKSNIEDASVTAIPRTARQHTRKAKTKSELAALRREMMKKKFKDGQAGSLNRQNLVDASVSYPSQMASQL